jgi:glycosyltransferase involved in cell wall biosynthesis
MWASANQVELRELTDAPRRTVLDAMQDACIFVFLPQRLDACPRTLIEAEAAGCEIVTNHHAGRREHGPLDEVMAAQKERFWSWM